jgi:hypothetical protein
MSGLKTLLAIAIAVPSMTACLTLGGAAFSVAIADPD